MIASRLPWTTVSGVRSSWLTSASRRPPLALVGLEPGGHRVEAADQLAHRPTALARRADAHGIVAGLDPAGGLDQPVERSTGGPERPADADQRGDDQQDDQEPGERPEMRQDESAGRDERPGHDQEEQAEQAAEPAPPAAPRSAAPWRSTGRGGGAPSSPLLSAGRPVGGGAVGRVRDVVGLGHHSGSRSSAKR